MGSVHRVRHSGTLVLFSSGQQRDGGEKRGDRKAKEPNGPSRGGRVCGVRETGLAGGKGKAVRGSLMVREGRVSVGGGGGDWHKALVVGSVSLWRRLLASRP